MIQENEVSMSVETEIVSLFHSDIEIPEKIALLDEFHDHDLSLGFLELSEEERISFLHLFAPHKQATIFAHIEPEEVPLILTKLPSKMVAEIFHEMQPDDLTDIIREMDPEVQTEYLSLISPALRPNINKLISFDEHVVGSLMNTSYVEIQKTDTIKQAIAKVVERAPKVEFIGNVFVTELGYLEGVVSLKELIANGNRSTLTVHDIMTTNLIAVTPETKNEEAIEIMQNYDFLLLPVVDHNFKMLGIASFDDIFDAINAESDTDYSRLAGVTDIHIDEEHETIISTVKKRMPWLVILLFVNLITSSIVSGYEHVLTHIPTLALFMPLILNMAGNSGTQSLGVIIRLFATNQLDSRKSVYKHLAKEFLTGVVNGIIIAILLFGLVFLLKWIDGQSSAEILPFAGVIALSIAVALVVSALAGALVPLVMNLIKVDPAVASGPFITTINDIISLLIYFGLASVLLGSLL
ncbi:MAG: magnesium transporter [Candidatus Izemoplasmatales bacterium]